MRVLGIDPGSETTGWGVVEGDGEGHKYWLIEFGAIKLSTSATFSSRLLKISRGLEEVITRLKPDACAIEEVFHATNPKVTLKLGQVRGVALLVAESAALEIAEYSASGSGDGPGATLPDLGSRTTRCRGRSGSRDLSFSSRRN